MKYLHFLWSTALFLTLGCGGVGPEKSARSAAALKDKGPAEPQAGALSIQNPPLGADAAAKVPEPMPRKIIYTAEANIVVEDFEKAEQEIVRLIKDHKGYVAQAETGGKSGTPRSGRWKVRIPVEGFEDFLDAVAKLGVPQKVSRDSKDVTEEFYDLEARLRAKKVEEARLLKHLEASTGKLEDILAVERELTRVRSEIEQQEGRLRLLANLSTLTTVTVHLHEIKDYVPPQAPSFGNTVSSTFADSLEALSRFGKGLVLAVVAVAPWLPLLAVVAVPAWLFVRGRRRTGGARTGMAPPAGVTD